MAAAGIMTLSVFAIGWVVLGCGAAFQFTTAFALKWLPVTINTKSEHCRNNAGRRHLFRGGVPAANSSDR
jgi:hypothetical protein